MTAASTVPTGQGTVTAKVFGHPLNAWYVAAWDHEVTRKPMARRIADRPLALYRTEDGQAVALADACWHRLAPLSMGKLVGRDGIQCPYHGIVYNSAGRCIVHAGAGDHQPQRDRAVLPGGRAVPLRVGLARATPPRPTRTWSRTCTRWTSPEWAGDGETIHAACNYQLVLDNLMDLTHEEFVHSSSIGQDELSESEFDDTHDGQHRDRHPLDARHRRPAVLAQEHAGQVPRLRGQGRPLADHPLRGARRTIRIDVGVAKAGTGAPEGDRSQGVNGYVMNTITPETDRTCHYFWAFMRNYRLDSQLITTQLRNGVHGVFGEDEAMLTAQQEAIDANPDYEFYSLNIDAGGMWVRRILDRMLEAEGRQRTAAADPVHRPDRRAAAEPSADPDEENHHGSKQHRGLAAGRPSSSPSQVAAGHPPDRPEPAHRSRPSRGPTSTCWSPSTARHDAGPTRSSNRATTAAAWPSASSSAPASRGGSVLMHALQAGDVLDITQPLQNFPLRVGAPRYVLLAGGIGITAIPHMATVLRQREGGLLAIVYAGRNRDSMAYLPRPGRPARRPAQCTPTTSTASSTSPGLVGAVRARDASFTCAGRSG